MQILVGYILYIMIIKILFSYVLCKMIYIILIKVLSILTSVLLAAAAQEPVPQVPGTIHS